MENLEKDVYKTSIELLEDIYEYSVKSDRINSQEFLDWLDKINEISVRN